LLAKFPRLASSGRHNFAMITGNRKFTSSIWSLYRCLVSVFTIRINSVFSLAVYSVQEKYLPKFLAMSDVPYHVLKLIVRCNAGAA